MVCISRMLSNVDDVLIASTTPKEHLQNVRLVLERLRDYGVVINPHKCIFGADNLDFLGHCLDTDPAE